MEYQKLQCARSLVENVVVRAWKLEIHMRYRVVYKKVMHFLHRRRHRIAVARNQLNGSLLESLVVPSHEMAVDIKVRPECSLNGTDAGEHLRILKAIIHSSGSAHGHPVNTNVGVGHPITALERGDKLVHDVFFIFREFKADLW